MLKLLSATTAIRIAGAAAQLLLTIVVARLAGAAEAGVFFFGYSIFMVLSAVSRLGLDLSVLREVAGPFAAGDATRARHVLMARLPVVFYFSLLVAAGLAGTSPLIANYSLESAAPTLLLLSCAIPASALLGVASEALKASNMAGKALLFQNLLIPALIIPSLLVMSRVVQVDALFVAEVLLVAAWLSCISSLFVLIFALNGNARGIFSLFSLSLPQVRLCLGEARHLLVVSLASVVMQWFGSTALGFGADAEAVAGYAVASRLAIAVSIIHSAAAGVLGPRMAVAFDSGDMDRLKVVVQRAGLAIALLTWPVLIIMTIWASDFMAIFGSGYEAYSSSLQILLLGQFVAAIIGHSGMVLVMTGKYREARWNSTTSVLALMLLSLALIPPLQAPGAALAMTIAVSLGHLVGLLLVRIRLGMWTVPIIPNDLRQLRQAW